MNRSVSEEVLGIEREMNGAHHGMRRNASRNIPGIYMRSHCLQII